MKQVADYPQALADLVGRLRYKEGWTFRLADIDRGQGCQGLTLEIIARVPDSYHPKKTITVSHYMIVPAAAYNARAWRRWLLRQILEVEKHEAMEFFRIGEDRPYRPVHAPGADPYAIAELSTETERRTAFTGTVNPA